MRNPVHDLLIGVRKGAGGTVLVSGGDPDTTHDAADLDGLTVLRSQGYEAEHSLRFAGLADLVRAVESELRETVPSAAGLAASTGGGLGAGTASGTGAGPHALGRSLAEGLRRLALKNPVLVAVTDAHWLDPESSAAIAVAVHGTADAPIAWLLAVDDAHTPPLGTLAAVTCRIAPTKDATATATITAADLPAPTRRALLVLAASGTRHVDEVGGALRQLRLHGGDLAPAVAAGLIEATGDGWRFCHQDTARTVYDSATAMTRRVTHSALAESLREIGSGESGELLARHLAGAAASTDAAAASAVGRAADGARLRGALDPARSAYQRAASLAPDSLLRATWLAGAADTARLLGDLAGVARAVRESRLLSDDPGLHRRLDLIAARTSALRSVQSDLRTLIEAGTPYSACDLIRRGRSAEAEALLAPVVQGALLADPLDLGPLTLPALAAAAMWTGDGGAAWDVLDRSITLLRAYGAVEHLPPLLIVRAEVLFRLGNWPAARDDAEAAADLATRLGQTPIRAVARGLALRIGSLMGSTPSTTTPQTLTSTPTPPPATSPPTSPATLDSAVPTARRTTRTTDVTDAAYAAAQEAESLGSEPYALWSRHAAGTAYLAAGKWREAAVALAGVADGLDRLGLREPSILPVAGDLVEAALRIGELARARRTAQTAQVLAAGSASTVARAVAERCLGQVGEVRSARPCFEAALRLHAETGDRYEEGRTLFAYGRLEQDKRAARGHLEQAADRFAAVGAWPWLEQVEHELSGLGTDGVGGSGGAGGSGVGAHGASRAAGGARSADRQALEQLTAQEARVATLVAGGATNDEAAAALGISPRTVEQHLSVVYAKLHIRRRSELARFFTG